MKSLLKISHISKRNHLPFSSSNVHLSVPPYVQEIILDLKSIPTLSLRSLISRAIFAFQYFVPSSLRRLSISRKCLRRICISCAGGSSRSWEHPSLGGSPACRSKLPCCMDITRLAYLPFQCCKLKLRSCNCGEGLSETQSQQLAEPLCFSGLTLVPALSHIIRTTTWVLCRF
jgi:hypothetical protein